MRMAAHTAALRLLFGRRSCASRLGGLRRCTRHQGPGMQPVVDACLQRRDIGEKPCPSLIVTHRTSRRTVVPEGTDRWKLSARSRQH